jgi:hypothetical protein
MSAITLAAKPFKLSLPPVHASAVVDQAAFLKCAKPGDTSRPSVKNSKTTAKATRSRSKKKPPTDQDFLDTLSLSLLLVPRREDGAQRVLVVDKAGQVRGG